MAITASLKAVIDGSLTAIGATDKLYFQKAGAFAYGAAGAITVNAYNDGLHVINSSNEDVCTSTHAVNLKYLTSGTVSIAGGDSAALNTVTTAQCLNFNIACDPAAEITAASFFVYGATEADAPTGMTVQGFEQGDAAWANVAGSGNAKSLGTSASNTSHDFYIGLSITPTTNGALTGTLKCSATCV